MKLADLISVIVYDDLWGLPRVVLILGTGVYITVRTGFFQFRCFGMSMKHAFNSIFHREKKDENDTGVLSPLEAMSTALGTTIGVGNIGGVASAIAVGGPGAVFWMWVAGLFGMIIKMAEITLAVHYRSKDANNEAYGGPNYYMKKGLGIEKKWKGVFKVLSFIFAFGFLTGYFINIQTYTVSEAVANTFNIDMMVVGIVYTIALYVMISGGLKSVGKFAMTMVPLCASSTSLRVFSSCSAMPRRSRRCSSSCSTARSTALPRPEALWVPPSRWLSRPVWPAQCSAMRPVGALLR